MEWRKGDMIDIAAQEGITTIGFTANAVIWRDNGVPKLVAGRGAALRVREKFPTVDAMLAAAILKGKDRMGVHHDYHCVSVVGKFYKIFAVQVKRHWRDPGDWPLTEASLEAFASMLPQEEAAVLNCPLIGEGGFADRKDEVMGMVERILNNRQVIVTTL